MPNTYTEKVMVASGVPFTPDEEHPYPPNPEEVGFETVQPTGGEGHVYDLVFNQAKDEVTLTEDSRDKIVLPLVATFIGSHDAWNALSATQQAKYRHVIFNDDGGFGNAYDIPHGNSNVGDDLDSIRSDFDTQIGDHTVETDVPSDAVFTDTKDGANVKTSATKTGSGTTVTNSIAANTSLDNAVGTLLNNDNALKSALSDRLIAIGTGTTDTQKVASLESAFNALSDDEKRNAFIMVNDSNRFDISSINNKLFTRNGGYSSGGGYQYWVFDSIGLSNATYYRFSFANTTPAYTSFATSTADSFKLYVSKSI